MEDEKFIDIMGTGCTWLRYVDDVLVVVPEDVCPDEKLQRLNEVDPKIQFTIENEAWGLTAITRLVYDLE